MLPATTGLDSTFARALGVIEVSERDVVIACLSSWKLDGSSGWQQVAVNIESETALALPDLVLLLRDFAAALAEDPADRRQCWANVCRKRHQLRGARLAPPLPAVLGRAAPIGHHAEVMSRSPGMSLTPDECEALLRRVALAGRAVRGPDARLMRGALVGRYVVWATFNPARADDSPFEHLPRTTDAIRNALGLGHCSETETLVLISYGTRNGASTLELFRPTIGDAEGHAWYRPHSDPAAPHGLTCPLDPGAIGLLPQPEVVHREVVGETLVFPLYLTI